MHVKNIEQALKGINAREIFREIKMLQGNERNRTGYNHKVGESIRN